MSLQATVTRLVAELNPEQRAAVLHSGGPVLVLAGAGTGKTRVITFRIAHLVAGGIAPDNVLALTFTNKAAGEMAERVAHFVGGEAARAMTIGTFHSLGLRMLEQDAKLLGYRRGISLLDAADQAGAVRQCLKRLKIDPKRHDPHVFLTAISNARNSGITPEEMGASPARRFTARVYQAYLDWLAAYHAMDFDDLILQAIRLLEEHPEVRDRWRARFRTILVDEYQDTNSAQLRLVRLLAEEHRQLCVVGDDDQSIYGWRGADFRNILHFEEHFPDATAIALTQNYRSTGHILEAANAIIGNNSERRVKKLWTDVGDGDYVQVVTCKDPQGEAAFVAAEIRRRRELEKRPYAHFGVLFRTSAQTRAIEEAFRLAGIPFRLVGAYAFFERKEVKDVLSYLRLLVNAHDEVSLLRVINFPQRGIGPKTLGALHDFAQEIGGSLWNAVERFDTAPHLNETQRRNLGLLVEVLGEARRRHREERDLGGLVTWLCDATGAREAWIRDPTEGPGGERRWKTVEHLIRSVTNWQARSPGGELRDYLRLVALDAKSTGEEENRDEVALMTLHAAKGLEWPVCFVIGCQEGLIPHQRTLEDSRGDVSEERRLFYVGLTRARRTAFLTLAKVRQRFHGTEPTRPSRFLREIPNGHRQDIDRVKSAGEVDKSETIRRFEELKARIAGPPRR